MKFEFQFDIDFIENVLFMESGVVLYMIASCKTWLYKDVHFD